MSKGSKFYFYVLLSLNLFGSLVLAIDPPKVINKEHSERPLRTIARESSSLLESAVQGISEFESQILELPVAERSAAAVKSLMPDLKVELDVDGRPLLSIDSKVLLDTKLTELGFTGRCGKKFCTYSKGSLKIEVGSKHEKETNVVIVAAEEKKPNKEFSRKMELRESANAAKNLKELLDKSHQNGVRRLVITYGAIRANKNTPSRCPACDRFDDSKQLEAFGKLNEKNAAIKIDSDGFNALSAAQAEFKTPTLTSIPTSFIAYAYDKPDGSVGWWVLRQGGNRGNDVPYTFDSIATGAQMNKVFIDKLGE